MRGVKSTRGWESRETASSDEVEDSETASFSGEESETVSFWAERRE